MPRNYQTAYTPADSLTPVFGTPMRLGFCALQRKVSQFSETADLPTNTARRRWLVGCASWTAVALAAISAHGQSACPARSALEPTPAEAAYAAARYNQAEDLFGQELVKHPEDLQLSAGLVETFLKEGQVSQASAQVQKAIAQNPNSAITLTALAEVQLHQGQPWLTLETLKNLRQRTLAMRVFTT